MRQDTVPRFFYPHLSFDYTKNHGETISATSVVTVAYLVGENSVTYAASFCAPNDPFNKQRGRLQAQGRLAPPRSPRTVSRSSRTLPFETETGRPEDLKATIILDLMSHLPSRWSDARLVE